MDYDYVENNFSSKPITKDGVAELGNVGFLGEKSTFVGITIKTNEAYSADAVRKANLLIQPTAETVDEILNYEGNLFGKNGPFVKELKDDKGYGRGEFQDKYQWVPPIDTVPPPPDKCTQVPFPLTDSAGNNPCP